MKVEITVSSDKKILLLTKKNDEHANLVRLFLQDHFAEVSFYEGDWKEPFPKDIFNWKGDVLISYLSRWIVPPKVLENAKVAINFHPAPNSYPGIGCNNFALYNNETEYGVTCHHMKALVDTGNIIAVKKFPVYPSDTVQSLLVRTYSYQLILFYEIIDLIMKGQDLPEYHEGWTRKPYKRSELNQLSSLHVDMSSKEIDRRIRATNYLQWKPKIKIGKHVFTYSHTSTDQ